MLTIGSKDRPYSKAASSAKREGGRGDNKISASLRLREGRRAGGLDLAKRMVANGLSPRERAFLTLAFIGLTAPFMPVPGDHATRIAVQFRRPGMIAARSFAVRTDATTCAVLAATLSFRDPAKASFTRVNCARS